MKKERDHVFQERLTIRGIHRREIIRYVQELGEGSLIEPVTEKEIPETQDLCPSNNHNPELGSTLWCADGWTCAIGREESLFLLQSEVPQVALIFQAEKKELLEELLKQFRRKTLRAGA